jgi:shikimate dehydrogenase
MIITGKTRVFGVIGYPVRHSLSPVFQNAAFEYLGIDAVYVPFEIKHTDLSIALEGLRSAGVVGLNVTVPFKEEVLTLAQEVSEEAYEIGAANTVLFTEKGIKVFNTDWIGFLRMAREVIDLRGRNVLVLGAGGASRAVLYALRREGANTLLWNRTKERAERLAEVFSAKVVDSIEDALPSSTVIINTTTVGLKEDDPPLFDYNLIKPYQTVFDIIYHDTLLVKSAKDRGARAVNGLEMLIYQGAESFKIWTGCEAPVKVMRKALYEHLGLRDSSTALQRT